MNPLEELLLIICFVFGLPSIIALYLLVDLTGLPYEMGLPIARLIERIAKAIGATD